MDIANALRNIVYVGAETSVAGLVARVAELCRNLAEASRVGLRLVDGTLLPKDLPADLVSLLQQTASSEQPSVEGSVFCGPLRGPTGQPFGVMAVQLPHGTPVDMSLWTAVAQALAAQLQQRDRLQTLERGSMESRMVNSFAHVIRNALTSTTFCFEAIRLTLEERGLTDTSEAQEALESAKRGVDRALRVTSRIWEFAQASHQAATQSAAGVGRIVQTVLHQLGAELRAQNIRVEQDIAAGLVVRMADLQLQTLLTHLLINARDALQDAQPAEGRTIHLRAAQSQGMVQIIVEDNGAGMTPEAQSRLFEPFFTTKGTRYTGMGLTLCRRLMELCGGDIDVFPAQGHGTIVQVRLPAQV